MFHSYRMDYLRISDLYRSERFKGSGSADIAAIVIPTMNTDSTIKVIFVALFMFPSHFLLIYYIFLQTVQK